MRHSQNIRKKTLMIAGAGLFTLLAGCATATNVGEPASAKSNMPMADKTAMRAECQTMHDSMMAGKPMDKMMAGKSMGNKPGHKMMTPEMMQKHQTCMDIMPEMKAKMEAKCAEHKAGNMKHKHMGKGMMNHEQMGQHCAMMQSAETNNGEKQ